MRPPERAARIPRVDRENKDAPVNTLKRRRNQDFDFLRRRTAAAIMRGDDRHAMLLIRELDRAPNRERAR
jgi:hypothetical protein